MNTCEHSGVCPRPLVHDVSLSHPHPPNNNTTNTSIFSSFNTGDGAYKTMSGTSMATPAVAGGVACLMAADFTKVCSTRDEQAAQRLAAAMSSFKTPSRRFGDPPTIPQKIFYIPSDRAVTCPG